MTKKHYLLILAAIVILIIGYWLLTRDNKATAPEINDTTTEGTQGQENFEAGSEDDDNTTATNQLPQTRSAIAVSAQISGNEVIIDNFYLEEAGFIVIHELNNGSLGRAIGNSSLLNPGSRQDLIISAPIKANTQYSAAVYKDNGNQRYDNSDSLVMQSNGQPVAMQFQVGN